MAGPFTQKTNVLWAKQLQAWQRILEQELEEILDFWMSRMVDTDQGGFYGRIDGHGKLHPDADRGIILNSRILWSFAAAARHTQRADYAMQAKRAYDYLLRHFWDEEHGGVYWMVDSTGQPVNTRKQVYAQAFTIYALAEYYALAREEASLNKAQELYQLLEHHSRDKDREGYFEAYGRDWSPIDDLRLSEKDANEAKTMNTHLHVLEAYTNLYRVAPSPKLADDLRHLMRVFLDRFIDPATGHLHLFFDENWVLKSQIVSFGHDIECSWLLYEAAEVLGEEELLEEVAKGSLLMAEATADKGLDAAGALMNESVSGHLDTDRHWWPQAEAMVGFVNACQLDGKEVWLTWTLELWTFIQECLKDPDSGEWHWRVDAQRKVCREEDLAGPWKAPYHNSRACMELSRRIDRLIAE